MAYKIIINQDLNCEVGLSTEIIKDYQINPSTKIMIRVGMRQKEAAVVIKNNLKKDVIELSPDLARYFVLPLDLSYDIDLQNGILHIGPFIGLLLKNKTKKLRKKYLQKCCVYTADYKSINGIIFVFSREGIDMKQKKITGYYYQPDLSKDKIPWKKVTFPYPDVIYRRIYISSQFYEKLSSEMGNIIFNYPVFNKWQEIQWFKRDAFLKKYLPHTRLLRSSHDLDKMLDRYSMVFLKPVSSSLGKGIYTVTRKEKGDFFRFRPKLKGKAVKTMVVKNEKERGSMVNKMIKKDSYVVQQGIKTLKYEKRPMVFRIIMQKNGKKKWQCTGMIALLGAARGLDSHSYHHGMQMSFRKALKKSGNLSSKKINKIEKKVIDLCKRACSVLDQYGNYGDLGIDIVLDNKFQPWLIEINKKHTHEVPLFINDKKTYQIMKTRVLEYAKAFGGFNQCGRRE